MRNNLIFFFIFFLIFPLWGEELTDPQKANLNKAIRQIEKAEKADMINSLATNLKYAKKYLDLLKDVAGNEEVKKAIARYDAESLRLTYEKAASTLKSKLRSAKSKIKKYQDSGKALKVYEKKNLEKYHTQIQEQVDILEGAPAGKYTEMLKEAKEASNALATLLGVEKKEEKKPKETAKVEEKVNPAHKEAARKLKSALNFAKSKLKKFSNSATTPSYEKKSLEKYRAQIQEQVNILKEAPQDQYSEILKEAKEASSAIDNFLNAGSQPKDTSKETVKVEVKENPELKKVATKLKSTLGFAKSKIKKYKGTDKVPAGYEKKSLEKYQAQIQEQAALLKKGSKGEYKALLKEADEAKNAIEKILKPEDTSGGTAKLDKSAQKYLNKLNAMLTQTEQMLTEEEKKLAGGTNPKEFKNFVFQLNGIPHGIDATWRKIRYSKIDENHPEISAAIKRSDAVKQRINAFKMTLIEKEKSFGEQEKNKKEQKKALSQKWIDKIDSFTNSKGDKYLDPYSRPFYKGDSPEKVQNNLKIKLRNYHEAKALFAEYQKTSFELGKTSGLEHQEKNLSKYLEDFTANYRKYLVELYDTVAQKLAENIAHLKKAQQEAQKDPKKKPYVYPVRELVSHNEALKLLQAIAATIKETAPALDQDFSKKVEGLPAQFKTLKSINLENLKARASRTFIDSDQYQGKDSKALKKRAQGLLFKHLNKLSYKPKKPTILKTHLFYKDWVYKEEWVEGRLRTYREMRAMIAVRSEGEPLWVWGGTIANDYKNEGEYKGIKLEGDYLSLHIIYMAEDKIGGEWKTSQGNLTFTDPMAAKNLK